MRGDMSRQTPEIINPTPEEDAAINAGVAADPVTLSSISEMEPRPADPLERRPASGRFRLRRWVAYRYRSADPSAVAAEEFPVGEAGGLGDHLHREHVGGEGAGLALGLRNAPWRWRRWPGRWWQCWRPHRRGRPGSGPPVRGSAGRALRPTSPHQSVNNRHWAP